MKISYAWLREYVDLPTSVTPQEIAGKLTFAGLEVEALRNLAEGFDKVVVGKILERNRHPNADRLSLTKIDVGGPEILEIVCGAQNIAAGQKIPVAMVGAKIPNGLEIKPAKIRNVASQGMLCSLDELLLPKEWQAEDGIYQLAADAVVGMPFAKYLGREDWIFEINVTPNRGDVLSHIGVAREVAALFGITAKRPEVKAQTVVKGKFDLEIKNTVGVVECPRYFGTLIEGVKVGPSPAWLKAKLEAVGLRSISNVVDVTAFVMMEVGQPLHAFDADFLAEGKDKIEITVRTAHDKEKFLTLGEKEVELLPHDLLIAAGAKTTGVALAGVMGGKHSEVNEKTVNVMLESAEFLATTVRKTGRRLALLTDAGYRFERGVDPAAVEWAMKRAAALIVEVAGGKVGKSAASAGSEKQEAPIHLRVRTTEFQRLLGKSPDVNHVIQIFRGLGFQAEAGAGEKDVVTVTVPSWRRDIRKNVDLIEEVIRIWGFEHLESKLPQGDLAGNNITGARRKSYFQTRRIRRHLASLGFSEVVNYGFTSPEVLEKIGMGSAPRLELANPVSSDYSLLKPTLLPGLLDNIHRNLAHQRKDLRLFELRRIFQPTDKVEGEARLHTGVKESFRLALAVTGAEVEKFWQSAGTSVDFFTLKGVLQSLLEMLEIKSLQYEPSGDISFLHPGQTAKFGHGHNSLGFIGRLHPRVEKNYDFGQEVFYAEVDLDEVLSEDVTIPTLKTFSAFPQVERDFSVLVSDSVNSQMIRHLVTKSAKPLLKEFYFFDVYKGDRVPAGFVSYAFRLVLGSNEHTLADAEISAVQEKVMKDLENSFQARFAGIN